MSSFRQFKEYLKRIERKLFLLDIQLLSLSDLIIQNQQITTMKEQSQFPQLNHNSFRIKAKSHKPKTLHVGHYQIGQLIGKGGFAHVYKALQLHTKTEVAVKVVSLYNLTAKDLEHLKRQILIHKKLNHPNIARIYETIWTESNVYIFMQLVKGVELFDHLNKLGPMPQSAAAKIFKQIVSAVQYIHELNIAHRDIKTENIIIDSQFNAKLIDFGLAKIFHSPSDDYLQTFCGSPSYVAPQLLENKRYSGQRVDIWCLGVTLYVMLQACLPFDDYNKKARQTNIHYLNYHKPLYSTPQACELYSCIFKKERLRYSMCDITQSSFFNKYNLSSYFSKSLLSTRNSLNQDENSQLIKKVSLMLNVEEEQIKSAVQHHQIGETFCVYQILFDKKQFSIQGLQRKGSKKDCKPNRKNYNTVEPKTVRIKQKERPKSRQHESSLIKILPILNDVHHHHNHHQSNHNSHNKPHKQEGDKLLKYIEHDHYNLQIFSKQQIVKETIKAKAGRFKNIFTKDLCIKQTKPRLRQDSPDSPKRILDCVKRYN